MHFLFSIARIRNYEWINDVIISIASFLDGQRHSRSDNFVIGAEMSVLQVFEVFPQVLVLAIQM